MLRDSIKSRCDFSARECFEVFNYNLDYLIQDSMLCDTKGSMGAREAEMFAVAPRNARASAAKYWCCWMLAPLVPDLGNSPLQRLTGGSDSR
jgi:hypothetical protein